MVNFLFLFDLSILRSKWFLIRSNLFWGVKWSEKEEDLNMNHIYLFLVWSVCHSLTFQGRFLLSSYSRMGQNSTHKNGHHSEMALWEMCWNLCTLLQSQAFGFGVLCYIFGDIQDPCLLQPVISDCYFLATILRKVLRYYLPPFLLSSWCQVWQEHSVQKETLHHIMNKLTPVVANQEKVKSHFISL